ncbi:MAG: ATP-dependent Clp protease proteolytic subunit [Phycisphaerales bacterium]|nr:MAG: ATP-dependent Clp protease proteolytic subunit [Phycisphaerales bacterium]
MKDTPLPNPSPILSLAMRGAALLLGLICLLMFGADEQPDSVPPPADKATAVATAVPAYRQAGQVAVLTVKGEIDRVTLRSLERRVARAVRDGADAIVLELDTPGGALDAALDICDLIRSEAPANTVAWINRDAHSAGTIIALACREVVIAPSSHMGVAAPVTGLPGVGMVPMPAAERAKAESWILEEVVHSARRNHYDENLVTAFVSVGVELWLIEHVGTGERVFVDREEFKVLFGEEPTGTLTSITPSLPSSGDSKFMPFFDTTIPPADTGETIDPEEYQKQIEFAQTLPSARLRLTSADRDEWRPLMQIVSSDRLLGINEDEAVYYGLARQIVRNDQQLAAFFGADPVTGIRRYDDSWSEGLVRFLTHPIVMGVLIVIFIVSLFIEMAAPGFGVFGTAATIALLILIGAPFLAGMAQWWDILLIVVGLMLLAAEIFVIPGFGLPGVAGALCVLVGMVGTFVSGDVTTVEGQEQIWTGLTTVLTALFAAGVGLWFLSRYVPTIPVINRVILRAEVSERQAIGVGLLEAMGTAQRALEPGDEGVAATDLRPAGRAEIGGRMVDVKSVGEFIDKGTPIRVVSVGRFVIEVEETLT